MCELLGLAFNEPVTVSISFRAFQHRGATNPGRLGPGVVQRWSAQDPKGTGRSQ